MNAATLERMRKMKLLGMHRVFKTNLESDVPGTYTPDELIAHLIDAEWDDRQNRSILTKKRLKMPASAIKPISKTFTITAIVI